MRRPILAVVGVTLLAAGCGGSTGNDRVHFSAAAGGPADATGGPLSFTTSSGYHVVLTKARLHIGGLYLNQTVPLPGRPAGGCYLTGIYVAQVRGAGDVDLLSPTLAPFPVAGDGVALEAHTAEVWLTGTGQDDPLNAPDDATEILVVAGAADRGGTSWPFAATITIGSNWTRPSQDPRQPSAHPVCLERIVTPIVLDPGITLHEGATLRLRIDPRAYFGSVDFSTLPAPSGNPPVYHFANAPADGADISLYQNGLHATDGVYRFTLQ